MPPTKYTLVIEALLGNVVSELCQGFALTNTNAGRQTQVMLNTLAHRLCLSN